MSFTSNIKDAVQENVNKAKAMHELDNLTLDTKKVILQMPDSTKVMDQAAAETWNVAQADQPWMKYALWGAAAFLIYKFVLKK